MYTIDRRDKVVPVSDLPELSAGAPEPIVLADEHSVMLSYRVNQRASFDENEVGYKRSTPAPDVGDMAIVKFGGLKGHFFGMPNDEALNGHPLYRRGLEHYGVFEVQKSSWIRAMERCNSVHPSHRGGWLQEYRHLVFTFQDSIFECVAREIRAVVLHASQDEAISAMTAILKGELDLATYGQS